MRPNKKHVRKMTSVICLPPKTGPWWIKESPAVWQCHRKNIKSSSANGRIKINNNSRWPLSNVHTQTFAYSNGSYWKNQKVFNDSVQTSRQSRTKGLTITTTTTWSSRQVFRVVDGWFAVRINAFPYLLKMRKKNNNQRKKISVVAKAEKLARTSNPGVSTTPNQRDQTTYFFFKETFRVQSEKKENFRLRVVFSRRIPSLFW